MLRFVVRITLLPFIFVANVFANTVSQAGFEYQVLPPQNWVQEIKLETKNLDEKDSDVDWLLIDKQVNFSNNNGASYNRFAVKVLQDSGLKHASEFGMYFQPDYQTLTLHYVRHYRGESFIDITNEIDIRLLQREENISSGIYDGGVSAMALVKDVQVGDIVEYAFTVNGRNPIYKGEYFKSFPVSWSLDVRKSVNRIISDRPLYSQIMGTKQTKVNEKQVEDNYVYELVLNDIKAIYDEGDYPLWHNPYGVARFSENNSWKGVVDWAVDLYKTDKISNKELIALSDSWAKESKSKKEYASKVIQYVQDKIRYFGIEIGQNSHVPYHPDLVFERKFGDCKDKTTLINTLLARQGIEAYPALVSMYSRKGVEEKLPSLGAFDHVISTFKIDGKNYWVDGTAQLQHGTIDNIGISNFGKALVIKEGNNTLTQIDAELLEDSISLNEVYTSEDYTKPVKLSATFKYEYGQAEYFRSLFKSQNKQVLEKDYLNFFAKQFPGIKMIGGLVTQDNTEKNAFKVITNFEIPEFWKAKGGYYEVPLFGDLINSYVQQPRVIDRKMPLANFYPIKVKQSIEVNYNDEINWKINDRQLNITNKSFKYDRKIDTKLNQVKMTHSFQSTNDVVNVKGLDDYLSSIKDVREAIFYSVQIDAKSPSVQTTNLKSKLRNLLKKKKG